MLNKRKVARILTSPLGVSQSLIGLLVFGLGLMDIFSRCFEKSDIPPHLAPLFIPFYTVLGFLTGEWLSFVI